MRSRSTGLLLPPACRAQVCDACGPWIAQRTARAIDARGYTRWITLTRVPRDYRQYMARLAYLIRQEVELEWVWSVEHGPKTGMRHVHAIARAPWIENRRHELTKKSRAAGGGFAWIKLRDASAADYSTKCGSYAAKQAGVGYQVWRGWNGGRVWHWSRGYTEGTPVRDWVRYYAPSDDPGPWETVRARDVPGGRDWSDWLRGRKETMAEAGEPALFAAAARWRAEVAAVEQLRAQFPDARDVTPEDAATRRARERKGNAFDGFRQASVAQRIEASRRARRPV